MQGRFQPCESSHCYIVTLAEVVSLKRRYIDPGLDRLVETISDALKRQRLIIVVHVQSLSRLLTNKWPVCCQSFESFVSDARYP